jgi:hypothetical protein
MSTGASGPSGGTGASGPSGGTATSGTSNASTTKGAASTQTTKKEESTPFLTSDLYGILIGLFITVLSIFVLFSTGSFLAVMVLWATIFLILVVLLFYDIIDIDTLLPYEAPKKDEPIPQPSNAKLLGQTIGSEVFHISDQRFTYDEARAVCAAYDSELSTLEQIMDAFAEGAEWCSYGWSAGGMALYPTQKDTWQLLQNEVDPGRRTRCGRPGVNGGYFDPSNKFGVNCFGFKPKGNFKPPAPVPGADNKKFNEMVARFKNMMKAFTMDPYSRQEWSGYDSSPVKQAYEYGQKVVEGFMGRTTGYGLQFAQDLGGLIREGMENQNDYFEELGSESSQKFSAQGPYGLRGDLGPTGAAGTPGAPGAAGTAGAVGPTGPVSTVDPNSLAFTSFKIGNWDIKTQGDDLLFDDRTTTADDGTNMFKINRMSGSAYRGTNQTSTGGSGGSGGTGAPPTTPTPPTTTTTPTPPTSTTTAPSTSTTTTPSGPTQSEINAAVTEIDAAITAIGLKPSIQPYKTTAITNKNIVSSNASDAQSGMGGDNYNPAPYLSTMKSAYDAAVTAANSARTTANEISAIANPVLTKQSNITLRSQATVDQKMTALETLKNNAENLATDTESAKDTAGSEKIRGCYQLESYASYC